MINSANNQRSVIALSLFAIFLLIFSIQAEPFVFAQEVYYQLTDSDKRVLAERAGKIKEGDRYEAVIQKLGKPSFDQLLVNKESNSPVGRSLKYYAIIWEEGLSNELNDELVHIMFDEKDRVTSVIIQLKLK